MAGNWFLKWALSRIMRGSKELTINLNVALKNFAVRGASSPRTLMLSPLATSELAANKFVIPVNQ